MRSFTSSEEKRFLVFRAGSRRCALPVGDVQELLHIPLLSEPPALPAYIAGVLDLRGTAVPVVRLDRLLGLPEDDVHLHTPLIVLRRGAPPLALQVGALEDVVEAEAGVPQALAGPESFNGCVTALLPRMAPPAAILSVEHLFAEAERRRLIEFQEGAARRLAGLAPGAR